MNTNTAVPLEFQPCYNGCVEGDELILVGHDRLHGIEGEFSLVRCRHCGLIRTNPRPTREGIAAYYPANYGPHQLHTDCEGGLARLSRRDQEIPLMPPGRLLEVGCGAGDFLLRQRKKGWIVAGIENGDVANELKDRCALDVFHGAIEDAPAPAHPYDLCVAWMVLEHLHNPRFALDLLHDWTSPHGWLACSVPDAGSLWFSLFGGRWHDLDVPRHMSHFTIDTLRSLLKISGWDIKRVIRQRNLASPMASLGYLLDDYHRWPRLARYLTRFPEAGGRFAKAALFPVECVAAAIGFTDRLTIWAKRIDK
jgi:SAM-dependent methyltransferase